MVEGAKIDVDAVVDEFGESQTELRTLTLHTAGVPESRLNDRVADLFDLEPKVNVALLAGQFHVDIRLTQHGKDAEENAALEAEWRGLINERVDPAWHTQSKAQPL